MLLVPYVIRNPGVTVDELCRRFDVRRPDLMKDLELLFMCGLPGYGPGDLIEVAYEGDSVAISMADFFARPLRLTAAEATALYSSASALAGLSDMKEADSLRRALAKLRAAIGAHSDGGLDVLIEPGPTAHVEVLRKALQDHRRVHLEYFSASQAKMTERDVDPWGLVAALGRLYLVGLDHSSQEERMFRVDRIRSVTITDEAAEPPDDFDPARYQTAFVGEGGITLKMEISPSAARWFPDYYPVRSSKTTRGRWLKVELLAGGLGWAATLLLRMGADARAVEPPEVLDEARDLAGRIASRYS